MTRTTPKLVSPSPSFHVTLAGGRFATNVLQAPYTADRQWNWVSILEPSGPKAEILQLGHRGLISCIERLKALFTELGGYCSSI
ncbi:hypothetical protein AVEN_201171-1 [Araneus ventricosus]|uniref:Uncharacterized protein n=1 Tax=Araneus ventricosus TaxID=182803 RepID=A0A4Y2KFI6_ARAVE|nr:hypothetical protein AVEN_201171-1 [Araneus ventricosus]